MHYYSFNIGDYTSHTAHLSPVEDIAYRRLLDLYYQTELPIPNDTKAVCRLIRMRDHADDVQQVLSEFFTQTDEGWKSARCSREIEEYHAKAGKARANGKLGGRPKKQIESGNNQPGSFSFDSANQEETEEKAKQETRNKKQETKTNTPLTPHGGSAEFAPLDSLPADGIAPTPDELPEPHELQKPTGSASHPMAGLVCQMMKRMGVGLVGPGNAKLNTLLNAGVTVGQIEDGARKALEKGKSFTYALAIVEREFMDANALAENLNRPRSGKPAAPAQKSFAQQEREAGWLRWEEMTGRKHPEMEKIRAAESGFAGDVIDITPRGDGLLLEG